MTTSHRGLPVSHLTEFVGRESDLSELRTLVSSRRLVTITGEAGVGKSRTALRLAEMLRRSFGGSIVVVEMGGRRPGEINEAIGAAVGSADSSVAEIARTLGRRPHLIVVDGLDHADDASSAIEELLRGTSETRLVVTSRERTSIRGETPYLLSPLEVPSWAASQGRQEEAFDSPAASLLLRRIGEADPTFRTTSRRLGRPPGSVQSHRRSAAVHRSGSAGGLHAGPARRGNCPCRGSHRARRLSPVGTGRNVIRGRAREFAGTRVNGRAGPDGATLPVRVRVRLALRRRVVHRRQRRRDAAPASELIDRSLVRSRNGGNRAPSARPAPLSHSSTG